MGKVTLQKAINSGFCGSFAIWPESRVTRKNQPVNDLQIPTCASHVACFAVISHESVASPIAKTTSSQILCQTLTHSPTLNPIKIQGND